MAPRPPSRAASALAALLSLLTLAAAAALALLQLQPPEPVPASAPAEVFSAERAMAHVRNLAEAPHPVGSQEHGRVQQYLLAQLAELGLSPVVHAATSVRSRGRRVVAARVENLVGRLPGSGPGEGAVMLTAHYDTRATTPGAGDDSSGVAAILETLRALRAGGPLRNDLIVLLTDGEELGLLGARAFAGEHPWMEEIRVVLNFEARGNRGPAPMFETTEGNGRLVRALRRAAGYPLASSLSGAVYRRMPNDTDFTVFRGRVPAGLNFAFIGGHAAYHTALDTPERLDPGSLQHLGDSALGLARHFGGATLDELDAPEVIYFNLFGRSLVIYPASWAVPLALFAAALYLGVLALGVRRERLALRGAGAGFGVSLLVVVATAGALHTAWKLFAAGFPRLLDTPHGLPYDAALVELADTAGALGVAALVIAVAGRRVESLDFLAGVLAGWGLLALVSAFLLPGASYLFLWPLVAVLLALGVVAGVGEGHGLSPGEIAVLTLGALPAALLFAPTVHLLLAGLTVRAAAVAGVILALPLTLLAPQIAASDERKGWTGAAALLLAVTLFGVVVLRDEPGADRPRVDTLLYAADADTGEASWLSFDAATDPWTCGILGERPEVGPLPGFFAAPEEEALRAPAPAAALAPPAAELVADESDAVRRLTISVRSPRGGANLWLAAESPAEILALEVDGERAELDPAGEGPVRLTCFGLPPEGATVTFEMAARFPVELTLADQSYGFEALGDAAPPPRPEDLIPATSWATDSVFVARKVVF